MIKKIDSLGRIGIPKGIREKMNLAPNTYLVIEAHPQTDEIILKIPKDRCLICGKTEGLIPLKSGRYLCKDCIGKTM